MHQHRRIVVALQDQAIATIEHGHHVRCDVTGVCQHPQPPATIGQDELNRLAGIMGYGEGLDAEIAD